MKISNNPSSLARSQFTVYVFGKTTCIELAVYMQGTIIIIHFQRILLILYGDSSYGATTVTARIGSLCANPMIGMQRCTRPRYFEAELRKKNGCVN